MTPEENKEEMQEQESEELNVRKSIKKKMEKYEEEIEKLKADADHWKNEYYRAYADTKNLRTSLEKDQREAIKYRAEGFIEELLPVLDSFHMALANESTNPELKNYLVGFQYIYRNLVTVLDNEGVKEIAPKNGDKFDAATMNAVDTVETDGESNLVVKVYGNGYKLHERMIRHAMVVVSKKKEIKPEETKENLDA